MKIVFFATPQIAVRTFEALIKDDAFEIQALVTQTDKPKGRGKKICPPPMKVVANSYNIPVFQPLKLRVDKEVIEKLKEFEPDFFVTFAYGQILSSEVLDIPKFGTINVHASLLPKYRGANPIAAAILNNDKITGITTVLSVLELDAGDICLQKEIKIDEDETTFSLSEKISSLAPDLLKETLKDLYNGTLTPKKQDETLVSFAHKFKKEDFKINWGVCADDFCCKVRSMPCHTSLRGKKIIVLGAQKGTMQGECSKILKVSKEGIEVALKSGSVIIKKVKPEGKGEMDAYSFANGARLKEGDMFDD